MFELLFLASIALIILSQQLPEKSPPTKQQTKSPGRKSVHPESESKSGLSKRAEPRTQKQPCRINFSRAA